MLSETSETLYIPLYGRIYASKYHPDVLKDVAALSVEKNLPSRYKNMAGQNEYTCLASAVRSHNIDEYVREFLKQSPDGVVVNMGCGLETLYNRNDNQKAMWFELDLPEVLELRAQYLREQPRDVYLPFSIFDDRWIDEVKRAGDRPVLIIASGLFHYFKSEEIIELIKKLMIFKDVELLFDTVTNIGVQISKLYVKKMGRQSAQMYFYVNSVKRFVRQISNEIVILPTRKFYRIRRFSGKMKASTKIRMIISDIFNMVKMVHLKIRG